MQVDDVMKERGIMGVLTVKQQPTMMNIYVTLFIQTPLAWIKLQIIWFEHNVNTQLNWM